MAENKPKDNETAAEAREREARDKAHERVAVPDVPQFTQVVVGAVATPMPTEGLPDASLDEAAGAMLARQEQEAAGVDATPSQFAPSTAPDYVEDEEARRSADKLNLVGPFGLPIHPDRFRAEKAQPLAPPGESERGWSPENVARHPAVLAATMREIAGGGSGGKRGGPKPEGIDANDPVALQAALRETGFVQVRMNDLRNKAIRLAATRLAQIQEAHANSGVHAQIAAEMAIKMAEANAESSASAIPEDVLAETRSVVR